MSAQARDALAEAEIVLGYKTYLAQIENLLVGKDVRQSGMTKELDRAGTALDLAEEGRRVALVSGGDAGIYAMAGVVFDLARARDFDLTRTRVRVIPGIPALAAAAAALGAPITHDFAAISLSDRLTPWELIEKRLDLSAQADLVIILYNPKSKGRDWQYARAMEIVGRRQGPQTPVGVVSKATRPGQSVTLTTLENATTAEVDMQTIVIIGNSQTATYQGRMITPRGYLDKYPDRGNRND